jgi:alginate O-acetyltransferase complex protein AlgI
VVFSSPLFLFFLVGLLAALALPFALHTKKYLLAMASSVFYAVWDYRYLALLLGIGAVGYVCAARLHAHRPGNPRRRWWLISGVVCCLCGLGYFKYANFFIANVNLAASALNLEPVLPALHVVLPAGISFYTFKTMSYVIDVARGEIEPCRSPLDYVTFITFFPELIAGPIVRASVFLPQMGRPIGPSWERVASGGSLFLVGFTKKIFADRLGMMVTPIFADPSKFAGATLWAAALGYALQIYCDFSGYSDMAIGTAKTIGYDLPENFRMPYLSASVSEFWRRWHITLSLWLRDYLYIPLGGNRRGNTATNLMITMILGGLWHGASWNFVLWGALHGIALAVHRSISREAGRALLPRPIAVALTFGFVVLCWIPFRCASFGATWSMLRGLFGFGQGTTNWVSIDLLVITTLVAFGHLIGANLERGAGDGTGWVRRLLRWLAVETSRHPLSGIYLRLSVRSFGGAYFVLSWILFTVLFTAAGSNPFIYFQF